jgi:hypothetical protein
MAARRREHKALEINKLIINFRKQLSMKTWKTPGCAQCEAHLDLCISPALLEVVESSKTDSIVYLRHACFKRLQRPPELSLNSMFVLKVNVH